MTDESTFALDGSAQPGVCEAQVGQEGKASIMSAHAQSSVQSLVTPIDVRGLGKLGVYAEGIFVGLVSAVAIAVWFLALDTLQGRPLHTPMVLGTTLFGGPLEPGRLRAFETVVSFTGVHTLVFLPREQGKGGDRLRQVRVPAL